MKPLRISFWLGLLCFAATTAIPAATAWALPGNLILQVPDWNQPLSYGVVGYPLWCSPTAGANVMGYWEDVNNCVGLTDRQAFNLTPGYPATAGTWEQGLWHDGMVEMGWFMNTGGWQGLGPPIPFPPNAGSTALVNIATGLFNYATTSWTDNDYPPAGPAAGTGIVKNAFPNTTVATDALGGIALAQMWLNYTAEIDAARPVVCSFEHWVDSSKPQAQMTIDGFAAYPATPYPWDLNTDPHSVAGVGYIDITPGFQNNNQDEWFICQDGWGTTVQYVAVPLDSMWLQNDYVTNVPEPGTLMLLLAGATALLRRRGA